jgi:F-type H+-transporting ATPase subunit gamma
MEMVSAAKFKRVWSRLAAIRPYAAKLKEMTGNLFTYVQAHRLILQRNVALLTDGTDDKIKTNKGRFCIIAITSNKGLCGGYNANIIKTLSNFIVSIETEKEIEIVPIGKKVLDFTRRRDYKTREVPTPRDMTLSSSKEIIDPIIKDYEQGLLSEVWLLYSEFINPMVTKPKSERFLPFDIPIVAEPHTGSTLNYLFEPKPNELLDLIIPRYLEVLFYRTLLEAYSSEHSTRMMAMRNATKNASEIIDELTLTFNKARQASITNELLDIVAGAEVMR